MKISRSLCAAGFIVAGGVAIWMVQFSRSHHDDSRNPPSPSALNHDPRRESAPPNHSADRAASGEASKQSFLDGIERSKSDPAALLALAREINVAGLGDDREILWKFKLCLGPFSSNQLSDLIKAWTDNSGRGAIVDGVATVVTSRADPVFFSALIKGVSQADIRATLIERMVRGTTIFSPDQLHGLVENLAVQDRERLGIALAAKLSSSDPDASKASLESYLVRTDLDPVVGKHLAGEAMQIYLKQDPEMAEAWCKGLPAGLAQGADGYLMDSLASGRVQDATDFINDLMENGETQRASKAALALGKAAYKNNYEGALAWGLSLPQSLPDRDQILFDNVVASFQKNPAATKEIVDRLNDPKISRMYQQLAKANPGGN